MSKFAGSLRSALRALPQEICDLIYQEVFTASDEDTRDLNGPSTIISMKLMHVSHASREQYAATFYNTEITYRANIDKFVAWLRILPKAHLDLISKIIKSGSRAGIPRIAYPYGARSLHREACNDHNLRYVVRRAMGEEAAGKVYMAGRERGASGGSE